MVAAALYPDPKIIYDPDPEIKPSLVDLYGAPFAGLTLGLGVQASWNFIRKRPMRSSIPLYLTWGLGTAAAFEGIHRAANIYFSRRDTMHKHYVLLHPEDFPPPPKVKIGELLEDWNPVR